MPTDVPPTTALSTPAVNDVKAVPFANALSVPSANESADVSAPGVQAVADPQHEPSTLIPLTQAGGIESHPLDDVVDYCEHLSPLSTNVPLLKYATELRWKGSKITLHALLDSGATSVFINPTTAARLNLTVTPLTSAVGVEVADGDMLTVQGVTQIFMRFSRSSPEIMLKCLVVDIQHPLVLGLPFLRACNPHVDWSTGTLVLKHGTVPEVVSPVHAGGSQPNLLLTTVSQIRKLALNAADVFAVQLRFGAAANLLAAQLTTAPGPSPLGVTSPDAEVQALISKYADLFETPTGLPPAREVEHAIDLVPGAEPFARSPYRLSQDEEEEMKKQISALLDAGLIKESVSSWASPILFVRKKSQELRMCVDYRILNKSTIKDRYPLPNISELLDAVARHKYYTKLDLRSGYHQVRLRPEDTYKTAFSSKLGLYEYLVLPFGLCNAPSTFSRLMATLFRDLLYHGLVIYIDDLVIYSNDKQEHLNKLELVFQRLREHKLFLKGSKCEFLVGSTLFLGHTVSEQGIGTEMAKVEAIQTWPKPANVHELRQFLGLANYYRRFIFKYASITKPLTELLQKNITDFTAAWSDSHDVAFAAVKEALTSSPLLLAFNNELPTAIFTDASGFAVGGVLAQDAGNGWQPVSFESRTMNPAETRYDVRDQEMLAIVHMLTKWRHYLVGRPFQVFTDHHSLQDFHTMPNLNKRQSRWLEFLVEFDWTPKYLPGAANVVADALSRRPGLNCLALEASAAAGSTLISQIRAGYTGDPDLPALTNALHQADGLYLHEEAVYVPASLRARVIHLHHDSAWAGHPGARRCIDLIRRNYWWPTLVADVEEYVRTCTICQANKPSNQRPAGLLQPLPVPARRWQVVTTDLITELPVSHGCDTIVTFTDKLSRMVHFVPVKGDNFGAVQYAEVFINTIFRAHGMPEILVSDRDPRFTSEFWRQFTSHVHVKLAMSTAHHPETDGSSERAHRTLEQYLRCFCSEQQTLWFEYLPLAEFAMNNAVNASTGYSPFYLNVGENPPLPEIDIPRASHSATPDVHRILTALSDTLGAAHANAEAAAAAMAEQANRHRRDMSFSVGDQVLLSTKHLSSVGSKKLRGLWMGPFTVVKVVNPVAYKLQLPASMIIHDVFHISLLKPFRTSARFADDREPPPPPVLVDGQLEDEVDAIIGMRRRGRGVQYLVRFTDDPLAPQWLPGSRLTNCQRLLAEFHARNQ